MKKLFNEGNQIHNFMSSSGSGTVTNYGSGSDFLTSYGSVYGSGFTSQKVTVPTVPVPQHCLGLIKYKKEIISAEHLAVVRLKYTSDCCRLTRIVHVGDSLSHPCRGTGPSLIPAA